MENLPRISVIMNCLNGAAFLREAIDSVVAQSFADWEIVFYDDNSTDDSAVIAMSYGEKVRYFRSNTTIPLGAARNEALRWARGNLIAFLDVDDRWLPEKLAQQVAVFDTRPEVDFIYGNAYFLETETGRTALAYRTRQPEGDVFRSFLRYYPVNLQTVMLRRSALEGLTEWFDPNFHLSEEYDLFMRILLQRRAAYLHEPLAVYRIHPNMSSIVKIEKYPVENQEVLNKLRRLVPNLDQDYRQEVSYLEGKIGYWYAAAAMRRGDRRAARQYLAPHRRKAPEFLVLYLVTFFPTSVWTWLQTLRIRFRPT